MKLDYDKVVQGRIKSQDHFGSYRKTQHTLRRLVAGDLSPLGWSRPQKADEDANDVKCTEGWSDRIRRELYDVQVSDVQEGRSNQMWQAIKTLVMQTAYKMPAVEFDDLSVEEATVNAAYLNTICGAAPRGCNAVDEHRMALLDYAIGGTGATMLAFKNGRPVIEYADVIDLTWDTAATLIPNIRWVSKKVRLPLWEWIDMFGQKPFESFLTGPDGEPSMEERVELEWYYDVVGNKGRGSHYVIYPGMPDGEGGAQILDSAPNPFYCDVDGGETPFIPVNVMYYLHVPSVRYPMSIVQMMLPHQIAIWRMEGNFNDIVQRGRASYAIEEGSMETDALNSFIQQRNGGVVKIKKGTKAPEIIPGLSFSTTDLQHYSYHDKQLVAQGGANPYAGGSRVDGVEFSSEVASINAAGDLMAGNMSKDHTMHWERSASMLLKAAATYDVKPITLRIGAVQQTFDDNLPIKLFLRPDAAVVVKENSAAFRPRSERMNEAAMSLKIAQELVATTQGRFMPFLEKAAENYLRSTGEKNIDEWMKYPDMPAAPPDAPAPDTQEAAPAAAG